MLRHLFGLAIALAVAVPAQAQGPAATVTDLAWMTGHYANDALEENQINNPFPPGYGEDLNPDEF